MPTMGAGASVFASSSVGWELQRAEQMILGTYGDTVSIETKNKALHIFGHGRDVTTAEQTVAVFDGGDAAAAHETLLTSDGITHLSSSSGSDTHTVSVEGHTISGDDLTFVVQTATLTGQTAVALTTPLARCSKITNTGTVDSVGVVYAHEGATIVAGVPDTSSEIHCQYDAAGHNRSHKGATSISSVDYLIITEIVLSLHDTASLEAHLELQTKSTTGVWLDSFEYGINSVGTTTMTLQDHPYLIVPKNHDVRFAVEMASGSADSITVHMSGYLASVV